MLRAQGGDPAVVDDPTLLPQSRHVVDILYEDLTKAWVADVDSRKIAGIVLETGAGRRNADDRIDPASGISSLACVGDPLEPGDILARLHHPDRAREKEWIRRIREAIVLSDHPVVAEERVHLKIT